MIVPGHFRIDAVMGCADYAKDLHNFFAQGRWPLQRGCTWLRRESEKPWNSPQHTQKSLFRVLKGLDSVLTDFFMQEQTITY
jgi:hypothetical protein